MVFKLALSFDKPAQGANPQRGYPSPGAGGQTVGDYTPQQLSPPWVPERPTKGTRSFAGVDTPEGVQRGFPNPFNWLQRRPKGSMDRKVAASGLPDPVWTPYFSRGAAAYVQNYGKVLTNPIGAGVVAPYRPQASYGPAAQYANGAIWWTSQAIPTSVNLQGLTDPQVLLDQLGMINVQAVVRTTG